MNASPFHKGELAIQRKLGVELKAARLGPGLKASIPTAAMSFIENQSLLVISWANKEGHIRVEILFGKPGFVKALNETQLEINLSILCTNPSQALLKRLDEKTKIGILFIDLATRRRLRVNGKASRSPNGFTIYVETAYPNCPKYIQQRVLKREPLNKASANTNDRKINTPLNLKTWLNQIDTFFIGSSDHQGQMDVSHRGGTPGFIETLNQSKLKIPDYPGNNMFNTLGNIMLNPNVSLLIVNFTAGEMIHMTGTATIVWQDTAEKNTPSNTGRHWEFEITSMKKINMPVGFIWELIEPSPFNPA